MTDTISEALQWLRLHEDSVEDPIDDVLAKSAPRHHRAQEPRELKDRLERKYLSPSQAFSMNWLNRLQQ